MKQLSPDGALFRAFFGATPVESQRDEIISHSSEESQEVRSMQVITVTVPLSS